MRHRVPGICTHSYHLIEAITQITEKYNKKYTTTLLYLWVEGQY